MPGATSYEVRRNTSADPGSAELIAPAVSTTAFGDTSAAPEQIYHDWLKAKS